MELDKKIRKDGKGSVRNPSFFKNSPKYEEENELEKVLESKFYSSSKFAQEIEELVKDNEYMTYIDAIIHFCEKNKIDLESVPKLIPKPLKEKIKYEATELNFLKRSSRAKLPI
jgi:hypothetical protein